MGIYYADVEAQNCGVNHIEDTGVLSGGRKVGTAHVTVDGQKSTYLDSSGNVLTVKRAFANITASQSNASIIAAVTSKKLRILSLVMVAGNTQTDITFQSNNTAISPLFSNAPNGGAVLPYDAQGWLETVAGEAFKCTTGAGATTGVLVRYVEV